MKLRCRNQTSSVLSNVLIIKQLDVVFPHVVLFLPARALSLTPTVSSWHIFSARSRPSVPDSFLWPPHMLSFHPDIYPAACQTSFSIAPLLWRSWSNNLCLFTFIRFSTFSSLPDLCLHPQMALILSHMPNNRCPTNQQVWGWCCPGITPHKIFSLERV